MSTFIIVIIYILRCFFIITCMWHDKYAQLNDSNFSWFWWSLSKGSKMNFHPYFTSCWNQQRKMVWNCRLKKFFLFFFIYTSNAEQRIKGKNGKERVIYQSWEQPMLKGSCEYLICTKYFNWFLSRSGLPQVFYKKGALKNFTKFTGKYLCQSLFIKKETLAQVFSCEFCEISESTFLHRTPLVVASVCRLGS